MDASILLIFAVVYLGMILGGLPFLQLDRTGIALLGAIALIGVGALSLEEAWAAVHAPTLESAEPATAAVPPHPEPPPPVDRWRSAKGIGVAAAVFLLFLFAPLPREVVALTAADVLMHRPGPLFVAAFLFSNVVSNVPAVLLLPDWPDRCWRWRARWRESADRRQHRQHHRGGRGGAPWHPDRLEASCPHRCSGDGCDARDFLAVSLVPYPLILRARCNLSRPPALVLA